MVMMKANLRINLPGGALAVLAALLLWAGATMPAGAAVPLGEGGPAFDADKLAFFEQQVRPLLQSTCIKCHGGEKVKGELRLTSRQSILKGGENGPAISIDQPATSLILKAISWSDDNLQMPPKEKLGPEKVAILSKWIEMGAPWTPGAGDLANAHIEKPETHRVVGRVTPEALKFWSFQPVAHPAVPEVKNKQWIQSPIDAFVLAKLEAAGLSPAAPASKTALLRRAYYDLAGLPPSPADVDAFLADVSPDAFAKVIDRLLASPHYGEKWGRHWLDVVRYAETNSFERDGIKPNAWRFRDYVIESFNSDKPYDQFVREQIAGDELDTVTHSSIIATGFYRLGQWDDEPSDKLQARYDELDDIVTTVGQGFLGLTMNCCRCHDHKIDPIPQKDYYSLLAFFQNIAPYSNGPSTMVEILPPDRQKAFEEEKRSVEQRKEDARTGIAHFEKPVMKALTKEERVNYDKLKPREREAFLDAHILANTNADDLRHYKQLKKDLRELEAHKDKDTPLALAVKETSPNPVPTFILKRGNPTLQGDAVTPAFPEVLSPPKVAVPQLKPGQKTTGLRRELAKWLTDPKNPMPARVMANRIWEHHFGRGIVRSPNDFGFGGEKPTHPELLDYLASEFVAHGWSMKAMHRTIMLSAAYQMSSAADAKALAKDPQNDLFWRFDMRRLTAEEIRDSILSINGKLNLAMGGPGIYPTIPDAILAGQSVPGKGWGKNSPEEASRRSVYIHVKRSLVVPLISAFDGPDTDFSCPARFTTTQSTQALLMLNSEMINEEARALAARLKKQAGDDPRKQVELALRLALSRTPDESEITRGVTFMQRMREKYAATPETALNQFSLLVLNLNEFAYLD